MIRKITEKDREIYYSLADEFYSSDVVNSPIPKENYKLAFDEFMRSDEYAFCYVFEHKGVVCGFASLSRTFSQEAGGISVTLEEIYVEKEYRNKGIGKSFFEFLFKNIPAARYRLEVESDNEKAKKLYGQMGFEVLPYVQMVIDKHNKECV